MPADSLAPEVYRKKILVRTYERRSANRREAPKCNTKSPDSIVKDTRVSKKRSMQLGVSCSNVMSCCVGVSQVFAIGLKPFMIAGLCNTFSQSCNILVFISPNRTSSPPRWIISSS